MPLWWTKTTKNATASNEILMPGYSIMRYITNAEISQSRYSFNTTSLYTCTCSFIIYSRRQKKLPRSIRTTGARLKKNGRRTGDERNGPFRTYSRLILISPFPFSGTGEYTHARTVCAKKKLPCTVRFTPDRLSKTEVKRLSNGLGTDIERTENGR